MNKLQKILLIKLLVILFAFLITGFGVTLNPTEVKAAEKGKSYKFNYPSWETPGTWLNENFYFWWPRRVQELTKGQVVFQEFPGGTLIPGFDHYESVRDKVIPFAPSAGAYEIDTLPLATVFDLPNWWEDNEYETKFSKVRDELLNAGLQDYFHKHGVHVFAICPLDRYTFWTTKKWGAVKTLADAKGLKIRSPGGLMSQSMLAMGAVPVTLATGDIYTSLQRGLIDGIALTATSVVSLGIIPVLDYWTPQAGGCKPMIWIIGNYDRFKAFPKDIQDKMVQAGHELQDQWWGWIDNYLKQDARKECEKNNLKIIDLTPDSAKEFAKVNEKVWKDWEAKHGAVDGGLGKKLIDILKKNRTW